MAPGPPVETAGNAIVLGSQLDAGDIADADDAAVRSFANHDVAEFFGRHEAALGQNRVGEFLALGCRLASGFACGVHGILRLHRAYDVRDGDAQLCQLVGFYPKPHRVLAGAEYLRVANAWRTQDGIHDIDVRVVRQKLGIVGSVRRVKGNPHEGSGDGFANRDSVVGDVDGKLRSGLGFTRLGENEVGVRIGLYIEVHNQAGGGIARGIQRIHVVHVVHAIHLLLDGCGNRLFQGLRVRPDIGGQDLNLRRSDVGKLRHRQAQDGERRPPAP